MRNRTREQRRQRLDVLRRVSIILLALVAAIALIVLLCGSGPDPEPDNIQEYAARLAASEEYERMINLGYSEWSAQEAAKLAFEEVMRP